ncbi:hypothetical protein AX14_001821 [Amanita brunnescens Koide BX004]|nr:hypothetical protein AX14_001821 [Amanita brunnescens Koide BX004]
MKFFTLLPVLVGPALAIPASGLESHVVARGAACGDSSTAISLLRGYNAAVTDHFYTTDAAEMANAINNLGYTAEGVTGLIFPDQQPYAVPFYRLYSAAATDHFYTTDAAERDNAASHLGYNEEGITGYVYPDNGCGGQPLYRLYSSAGTDHFYTMSADERDHAQQNGYTSEGIAAYIYPAQS